MSRNNKITKGNRKKTSRRCIKDKRGKVLMDYEEIEKRWAEYMTDL